jgi:hypothetical protein
MSHVVVLCCPVFGTGDEAVFGADDLAGEEGSKMWMRVGKM